MRRLALLLAVLSGPAFAQTFPARGETPVTDAAGLMSPVAEAELAGALTAFRQAQGIEIALVTLPSLQEAAGGLDAEGYARALMADWGLGGATDKGLLLLTFQDEREVRIEAGDAVSEEVKSGLETIVSGVIVPAFAEGSFETGLVDGAGALMALATPAAAPATQPDAGGGGALKWVIGAIVALGGGLFALNRRSAARLAATPCESCGKTGLERSRVTVIEPTQQAEGKGETRLTCPHCGHVSATPYTIARLEPEKKVGASKAGLAAGAGVAAGASVAAAGLASGAAKGKSTGPATLPGKSVSEAAAEPAPAVVTMPPKPAAKGVAPQPQKARPAMPPKPAIKGAVPPRAAGKDGVLPEGDPAPEDGADEAGKPGGSGASGKW